MTQDIRDKAVRLLLTQLKLDKDPAEVADTQSTDGLGLSSLKLMNLMYDLEEAFDIVLDPEEMLGLSTVGEIVEVLRGKVAAQPQAAAS